MVAPSTGVGTSTVFTTARSTAWTAEGPAVEVLSDPGAVPALGLLDDLPEHPPVVGGVVDDQHPLPRSDGVAVHLQARRAVLQLVALGGRLPGQLARFAHDLKRFRTDLQAQLSGIQRSFVKLGDTWQDSEHAKFAEVFEPSKAVAAEESEAA